MYRTYEVLSEALMRDGWTTALLTATLYHYLWVYTSVFPAFVIQAECQRLWFSFEWCCRLGPLPLARHVMVSSPCVYYCQC